MKLHLFALLIVLATTTAYAEDMVESQADKFVGYFLNQYERPDRQFTQEQKDALRIAQPLLALVPLDKYYRNFFWFNLRGIKRTVSWEDAAQLIRKGEVRLATQAHSRNVNLLTYSGELLTATAPDLSSAFKVIEEVDPKHVFIQYSTE